jgi:hypothetical protein
VDFLLEGVRHEYGFRLDSDIVLEEWLHVYPKAKKQTWFHRKAGERILFSSKMAGENRTIENLTRKNCLFLSTAAQNNHETLTPVYQWFVKSVFFVMGERGFFRDVTAKLCGASEYMVNVTKLVAAADLGIVDMRTQEKRNTLPDEFKIAFEALARSVDPEGGPATSFPETYPHIQLVHQFGNQKSAFPEELESDGTLAYLSVLGRWWTQSRRDRYFASTSWTLVCTRCWQRSSCASSTLRPVILTAPN